MSAPPPTPDRRAADARPGRLGVALVVASVAAIAVQCYGLYRPDVPPQPGWLPHADKIGHLVGFALPVLLVTLTLAWFAGELTRRIQGVVLIVFSVQAVLSELVQGHDALVGRSGDVVDLAADALGIAIGFFAAPPVHRRLVRRTRSARS